MRQSDGFFRSSVSANGTDGVAGLRDLDFIRVFVIVFSERLERLHVPRRLVAVPTGEDVVGTFVEHARSFDDRFRSDLRKSAMASIAAVNATASRWRFGVRAGLLAQAYLLAQSFRSSLGLQSSMKPQFTQASCAMSAQVRHSSAASMAAPPKIMALHQALARR